MNCKNCNVEIERKIDKRCKNIFCSRSCSAIYNNKHVNRNRMRKQGICVICGNPTNKKLKRCRECITENTKENAKTLDYTIGELKALYKDKNSLALAAKIRGYGKTIYNNSDKPKHCIICGYDKHYEVCHVKAIKYFDDGSTMREVHALDNLIALCPNHHWEFDHNLLAKDDLNKLISEKGMFTIQIIFG